MTLKRHERHPLHLRKHRFLKVGLVCDFESWSGASHPRISTDCTHRHCHWAALITAIIVVRLYSSLLSSSTLMLSLGIVIGHTHLFWDVLVDDGGYVFLVFTAADGLGAVQQGKEICKGEMNHNEIVVHFVTHLITFQSPHFSFLSPKILPSERQQTRPHPRARAGVHRYQARVKVVA